MMTMIDKTLSDDTQRAILPHLLQTGHLVEKAIERETGREGRVTITAMPDLGLADNPVRMSGGFFTGMHIEWNACIPFVPVDATVNCCGVSIFALNGPLSTAEFLAGVERAREQADKSGYRWNFERGNHFIILCQTSKGEYYAILHASADEYKKSLLDRALYPVSGVWYEPEIKTVFLENSNRYLRYLVKLPAKRFVSIAQQLEKINQERMQAFAEWVFGNKIVDELYYVPHYGMPTESSIAIGCSWNPQKSVLLTAPGKNIFLIKNNDEGATTWLVPHGFGAEVSNPIISYDEKGLHINGVLITEEETVAILSDKRIRNVYAKDEEIEKQVDYILNKVNAKIVTQIKPLMTISKNGFAVH